MWQGFILIDRFFLRSAAQLCGVLIVGLLLFYPQETAAQGRIRVASEKAYMDLLSLWEKTSSLQIDAEVTNSPKAIRLAGGGKVDFALVGGKISEGDRAILGAKPGRLPLVKDVGFEALTLIVHPDNPIEFILEQEARCIFCGTGCADASTTLTSWNQLAAWQVGTTTAPVLPIIPDQDSEAALALPRFFGSTCVKGHVVNGLQTDADVERSVAADVNAIGVVYRLRSIQKARVLPVKVTDSSHPVLPDLERIASGEYPLTAKISLLYNLRNRPESPQSRFLRFVSSPEGQEDLLKAGFYTQRNSP